MTDILIRDVPEELVVEIDIKAAKAGISRTEYLRRVLVREQANSSEPGEHLLIGRIRRDFQ